MLPHVATCCNMLPHVVQLSHESSLGGAASRPASRPPRPVFLLILLICVFCDYLYALWFIVFIVVMLFLLTGGTRFDAYKRGEGTVD